MAWQQTSRTGFVGVEVQSLWTHVQEGSALVLMLCHCCCEILNNFAPHPQSILFCTRPHNLHSLPCMPDTALHLAFLLSSTS